MDNDSKQEMDLTPEEGQLLFRFFTEIGIINQLTRAMMETHFPPNLTATHFGIIGHLSRRPKGETPNQLALAFQVPKTTMTHMLKVLVTHGFIAIGPHPTDGRSKNVTVTPDGLAFVQQNMKQMAPAMAQILSVAGTEQIASLLPGLENIRKVMDAARD